MARASQHPTDPAEAYVDALHGAPHAGIAHLLVCLDRSALSESCIPHAITLAQIFDARITLLHVMESARRLTPAQTQDPLDWSIARHEAQAYLDQVKQRTETLVPTDTMLAQGHPAARITAVAAEIGADLTVLGTRGEGGHIGPALGSTVQQVLALARGSVFVARAAETPPELVTRRILVPLDGSIRPECVLPAAVRIAESHQAELLLAHVVSEPVRTSILPPGENLEHARELARRLESGAERYLSHVAAALARDGLSVRSIVIRDVDERQALLSLSEREHVDLIVVSAHGSTCNPARPFGSVASYLLSHARPAMLVIQDLHEHALKRSEGDVLDDRHATPLRGAPHTGPAEVT